MSDTKRGSKGPGYEYWGTRPGKGAYSGGKTGSKFGKRQTHKAERQEGKAKPADFAA